jgi:hypothetical protein
MQSHAGEIYHPSKTISSRILHYGDHNARAGRVRNRIHAAEADISDDVLSELIADSRRSSRRTPKKRFRNPIRSKAGSPIR